MGKQIKISTNGSEEIYQTFREQIYNKFQMLYETNTMCDVVLIAGINKQRISAHRLYLAAANSYFFALFTTNLKEKEQAEIILEEIHGNQLKMLIDFCYTGNIEITEANVYELIGAASKMEFEHIEQKCQRFLQEKLSVTNCLTIWTLVEPFINFNELVQSAIRTAQKNFNEVINHRQYLQIDVEHLLDFLKSDELNVYSEEEVFNALVKWVTYDENDRKRYVKELLSTIRFAYLKPEFLYEVVSIFCKKFECTKMIKDVYMWKLVPKSQVISALPRPSTTANRLIAFGNGLSSSEVFDPISEKWSVLAELTCERTEYCTAIVKDELFILGGKGSKDGRDLRTVQKFNFKTKSWTNIVSMTKIRKSFGVAVLNDNIYAAGGVNLNSAEVFDTKKGIWSVISSMLIKRSNFSLVSLNGKLYAVGGINTTSSTVTNSIESYNLVKKQWKSKASMNVRRSGHIAFAHNGRLYAVGGSPHPSNGEFYDPAIHKWTVIERLTIPRYGFGYTAEGAYLIIAGGKNDKNVAQASVLKINLDTLVQEKNIEPMKMARSHFDLVKMPSYDFNV